MKIEATQNIAGAFGAQEKYSMIMDRFNGTRPRLYGQSRREHLLNVSRFVSDPSFPSVSSSLERVKIGTGLFQEDCTLCSRLHQHIPYIWAYGNNYKMFGSLCWCRGLRNNGTRSVLLSGRFGLQNYYYACLQLAARFHQERVSWNSFECLVLERWSVNAVDWDNPL